MLSSMHGRVKLAAAAASVTTEELKRHVEVLADDTFEGRRQGSRGGRAAGGYIREHLERAGLKPAGSDGFFQALPSGGRNILAMFPGSDPQRSQEFILVGAHYDHVGYGSPRNSYGPTGYIHNGADDNASGVSALLELADSLSRLPQAPRRSLLLAFWDGEENGLLGSKHWAAHPTAPWERLRFAINMDMVGRLENQTLHIFGIRTAANLRPLVSLANAGSVKLNFDWENKPNSDHYTFYERSVPYLMFHTGLHGNYHRPSDDAHLLNYPGMQAVSRLLLTTTVTLADQPNDWSFRRAARQEGPASKRQLERPALGAPPRLGIRWESDERPGLAVSHVDFRSAADQAGIRAGDRITHFHGQPIGTNREFQDQVKSTVGEVPLQIVRDDETVELKVRLQGTPRVAGAAWHQDRGNPGVLLLSHVVKGGAADNAGLRSGDRIYAVNGSRATMDSVREAFAKRSGVFRVERDGCITKQAIPETP